MSREKTTLLRLGDPKNPDVYLEHDPETGEIALELGVAAVGYGASARGICAFIPMHLWEQIRSAEPSSGYPGGNESITLVEPPQPYERGEQPLEKIVILRKSGECLRACVSLDKSEVWIGIQWQGDGYAVNHRYAEFTFSEDAWVQIRRVGGNLASERVNP